jgi:hypothetical protein
VTGVQTCALPIYTYLDWYKKKQSGTATLTEPPAEKTRAFSPKVLAVSPVVGPETQGLGVLGTF